MAKYFSGAFLLVFMVASFAVCALVLNKALKDTVNPNFDNIWVGTWSPAFEKALGDALPISVPSRNFWGSTEYSLFNEGRKGVIVGSGGWLFTDEEFSCLQHAKENMAANLDYIKSVNAALKERKISLVTALIPAKARVYKEHLGTHSVPSCRADLYEQTLKTLESAEIKTLGLLPVFEQSDKKESLFLKTDTHWTAQGANLAAQTIAAHIKGAMELPAKKFATAEAETKNHEGDLLRYLPGVGQNKIPRDEMKIYKTEQGPEAASETDLAGSLFGDEGAPVVALVGTSYSANPLWNFPGFLKSETQADILDMSDEGLGPFKVMEKYLDGDSYKNTAPLIVIWEIPERYMTTKPEYKKLH